MRLTTCQSSTAEPACRQPRSLTVSTQLQSHPVDAAPAGSIKASRRRARSTRSLLARQTTQPSRSLQRYGCGKVSATFCDLTTPSGTCKTCRWQHTHVNDSTPSFLFAEKYSAGLKSLLQGPQVSRECTEGELLRSMTCLCSVHGRQATHSLALSSLIKSYT